MASGRLPESAVMVFGPRDEAELGLIMNIIKTSHQFARGGVWRGGRFFPEEVSRGPAAFSLPILCDLHERLYHGLVTRKG